MIRGMNWQSMALVFVGAGTGGVVRHLFNVLLNPLFAAFQMGTLAANVLGCGAAGALAGLLATRVDLDPALRPLLIVGFLGGLTTFSSFALEVTQWLELQRLAPALGLVLLHVSASLAAAVAGLLGIRALLG